MLIYGIHPVVEALKAGRVQLLHVSGRADARLGHVLRLASERGVRVQRIDTAALDRAARGAAHQGVLAEITPPGLYSLEELVREAAGIPLLVVLDGIEDPQNFGAILRTAEAAGVDGVVQQTRRAAPLGGATAKASAGALAYVKIARVVNIARALEELKGLGVWTVGLATDAPVRYDEVDFTLPTALVLGAEGAGLRRLVRDRCDWIAAIPMRGRLGSLNVSVAAAVAIFEVLRQRRVRTAGSGKPR